jgi:hypothetical protein
MEPSSKQTESRRFLLAELVESSLPLEGPELEEYNRLLTTEKYKAVLEMQRTFVEEELCRVVRRMLEKKFGPLGPQAVARLESFNRLQLEDLTLAFVDAESLGDLSLGNNPPA